MTPMQRVHVGVSLVIVGRFERFSIHKTLSSRCGRVHFSVAEGCVDAADTVDNVFSSSRTITR
jgi:hypothetical protein